MRIEKYGSRFWAVFDSKDRLVCVCVYKCGAEEVVRRFNHWDPKNVLGEARTDKEVVQ